MALLARRGFLGALLAAPAIVRTPGLLMAVKPLPEDDILTIRTFEHQYVWVEMGVRWVPGSDGTWNSEFYQTERPRLADRVPMITSNFAWNMDSDGNVKRLA